MFRRKEFARKNGLARKEPGTRGGRFQGAPQLAAERRKQRLKSRHCSGSSVNGNPLCPFR